MKAGYLFFAGYSGDCGDVDRITGAAGDGCADDILRHQRRA
jgi:hypothetical protein